MAFWSPELVDVARDDAPAARRACRAAVTPAAVARATYWLGAGCCARTRRADAPRVAVAALNPHAGEGGLLGTRGADARSRPGIARGAGAPAAGAHRGDASRARSPPRRAFRLARRASEWDGVVAMYHDQATIPMKLVELRRGGERLARAAHRAHERRPRDGVRPRGDVDGRRARDGGGARARRSARGRPAIGCAAMYERCLLPKGSVFSPSAAAVAKLVDAAAARTGGSRTTGGHAVTTVENEFGDDAPRSSRRAASPCRRRSPPQWLDDPDREELRLVWRVERRGRAVAEVPALAQARGRRSPTRPRAAPRVRLRLPGPQTIGRVPTTCACGEDLAFELGRGRGRPGVRRVDGHLRRVRGVQPHLRSRPRAPPIVTNPFDGTKTSRCAAAPPTASPSRWTAASASSPTPALAFAPELVAARGGRVRPRLLGAGGDVLTQLRPRPPDRGA